MKLLAKGLLNGFLHIHRDTQDDSEAVALYDDLIDIVEVIPGFRDKK